MAEASPLNPPCPCDSGRLLMDCCSKVGGGEFDDDEVDRALQALTAHGRRSEFDPAHRRNQRELIADLDPEEAERLFAAREEDVQLALLMLLHTELPARRGRSIAAALLGGGGTLAARPRALLAQWAAQPMSLYEVIELFPGEGVVVKDRLRGFTVRVHERAASRELGLGWFVIARVRLRADEVPVFDVPLLHFESTAREHLLQWSEDVRSEAGADGVLDPRDYIGEMFVLWQEYMAAMTSAPPLQIRTHDGEEFVSCTATFAVADAAPLRAALAAGQDWRREEFVCDEDDDEDDVGDAEEWTWLASDEDAIRVLGRLTLAEGRAVLEVSSRERLAAARGLLEPLGLRFVDVAEVTVAELMQRAQSRPKACPPTAAALAVDDADAHAAIQEALDRHYRAWVDQPLPAFGGRSPRQMAKSDPEVVSRAIWELCHGRGAQRYDARWMYTALGVRPLGDGEFEPGIGAR